jgi:hypothetical protein
MATSFSVGMKLGQKFSYYLADNTVRLYHENLPTDNIREIVGNVKIIRNSNIHHVNKIQSS